ncbi:hypothetical protein [Pararhizobium sp.]|uniref:hypothetical protein n=1 Tax=Pararhizobium sp. TaxID=1977563 RepID=UPI003D0BFD44
MAVKIPNPGTEEEGVNRVTRKKNGKAKAGGATHYNWLKTRWKGNDVWFAYTDAEMANGRKRAKNNPEDQPE